MTIDCEKYVLLIDGDNVNCSYLDSFVEYFERTYGTIEKIHLFGKLSSSYLDDWRYAYSDCFKEKTITYNVSENRKNGTDVRMVYVACKIFYVEKIKNVVIMSSDSDMTVLVDSLREEGNVMVAYCKDKVSEKYLKYLRDHDIVSLDLDLIRGELTETHLADIINTTMKSYISYKLGNNYFSYKAVIDWIVDRYPELQGKIDDKVLIDHLAGCKIRFNESGVIVS